MTMRINLPESPFLRIAIPLIAGIVAYNVCDAATFLPAVIAMAAAIASYIGLNTVRNPSLRYKITPLYPIPLFTLYVAAGWLCAYLGSPEKLDSNLPDKEMFFTADVESLRHRNVTTDLTATAGIQGKSIPVIITLQGNDYAIKPGDRICCFSKIEEIKSSHTPDSFDYGKYMRNNGFIYRSFVPETNYSIIGHHASLTTKAAEAKESVIRTIRKTVMSHEAKNFIIAILTGNDDFISDQVRDSFSKSGLSHILAVSGLHIGIIGLIMAFLLKPLDYAGLRRIRLALSIAAIWIFTYIIGMPPSACRAAIMATFVLAAILARQKHNILNALSASAVFLSLIHI